jgi:hypothetical protein
VPTWREEEILILMGILHVNFRGVGWMPRLGRSPRGGLCSYLRSVWIRKPTEKHLCLTIEHLVKVNGKINDGG